MEIVFNGKIIQCIQQSLIYLYLIASAYSIFTKTSAGQTYQTNFVLTKESEILKTQIIHTFYIIKVSTRAYLKKG